MTASIYVFDCYTYSNSPSLREVLLSTSSSTKLTGARNTHFPSVHASPCFGWIAEKLKTPSKTCRQTLLDSVVNWVKLHRNSFQGPIVLCT